VSSPSRSHTDRKHYKQLPHGTVSGYIYWGCRCEPCTQARRDYYGHQVRAEYVAEKWKDHGASAYKRRGCRCDVCREAMAETKRRYRAAHPEYNDRQNAERRRRYMESGV